MRSPKNTRNEMLRPMDKTILAVSPSLFNFKICKMSSPGTIKRRLNPNSCLRIGMSKRTQRSTATRDIRNRINVLAPIIPDTRIILI